MVLAKGMARVNARVSVAAEKNQVANLASQEARVKQLQKQLKFPLSERDEVGSEFWYLRPGRNGDEAQETCPIAVAFWDELDGLKSKDVAKFLAQKEQQQRIYGHYLDRVNENQPVMYLLCHSGDTGQVAMVLPSEGGLKQRNVQSFDGDSQALQTRLKRLMEVPIAERALISIPLVNTPDIF